MIFRFLLLAGVLLPLLISAAPRELYDKEGRLTALVFAPGDEATMALTAGTPEAIAAAFLTTYAERIGLKDPATQLTDLTIEVDTLGQTHLHWQQVWQGVPVRTGEVALHLDSQGQPKLAMAKVVPGNMPDTHPAIDAATAYDLVAQAWLEQDGPIDDPLMKQPELTIVDERSVSQVTKPTLVWQMVTAADCGNYKGDLWILDAQKGQVLARQDQVRYLDRRVYNCSNSNSLACPSEQYSPEYNYWFGRREGAPMRGPNPATQYGFGGLTDTDDMYDFIGAAHWFWQDLAGMNGANNLGGVGDGYYNISTRTPSMVLTDHAWSVCPDNAGFFGSLGRFQFCAGTAIPDVVGHEYFHAVVWFEFTPHGTEYSYEIGALEEGSCDVFGEMLDSFSTGTADWHQYAASQWGRNLANPMSIIDPSFGIPYPDHFVSPYVYCGSADHGGIHHNSTIPSHAAYLMAEGGLHNGCEIPAIGIDAVQRIWYRAWCQYFTRTTTFNESVIAFQTACQDLYGETHPEYLTSVTAALQAVEMDQPGYCSGFPEVAPACAVIGGGAAWTGLSTGDEDSLFTDAESVWLHSPDGVPGRRVLVHRLVPGTEPGLWEEIPSGADTLSVTVGLDGVLAASLGSLPAGAWTLLLDGDHDGFWQPWADQQLAVTITPAPPRVTGLTARVQPGENPPTRVRLDWNPLPDAPPMTQYQVEGDTLPQFPLPHLLTTTQDTTWTDSLSVTPPPLRLYRVKAVTP
jgi:Zn-dependent metalloprotease